MNFSKRLTSLAAHPLAPPILFLVVTALAYGLSFWRLGFYWDDLHISWIRYQLGPEAMTEYFSDARPVWGLLFQLTGAIIPQNPAYWQLFAMFWRWACVLVFWLVMERLFPQRKTLTFLLSLMVLLYPGFNQQWISYLYSHFFLVLFFLLFSWYLMLRGKTIPAMVFSALNLIMFEYFFLLEFIRPFLILRSLQEGSMVSSQKDGRSGVLWASAARPQHPTPRSIEKIQSVPGLERYIKTFRLWLPYIGVIFLVVLYRVVVFSHPGFGYSLTDELARAPAETFFQLVQQVFSSLWVTAVAAWLQVFQIPNLDLTGIRTSILYAFVVLTVGALIFFFKSTVDNQAESKNKSDALWLLGIGGIMLMLGGVPFWVSNLPVSLAFPASRATLSFLFGACFFLMGLIELLPVKAKYMVAILFISFSAGRQFLWSVDYMRDWQSQKNLFWQMNWRVPGLQLGTIVMMNEELDFYADNSISAALNWIYGPNVQKDRVDYVLFYPTNRLGGTLTSLEPGLPVEYEYYFGRFKGNTSQTVVFYYSPPGCLRLLDPEIDPYNRLIPAETMLREAAHLSTTGPVLSQPVAEMPEIYAPEPAHNWCYYFEKADLARQKGEWMQSVKLADQAFMLDDHPNDPVERFVFVEGYAHMGEWDKAMKYSEDSFKVSKTYIGPLLCRLWDRIDREVPATPEKETFVAQAKTLFGCNP